MTTKPKPDYLKYVGTLITIITIGAGIISGYTSLNARVDSLEKTKADEKAIVRVEGQVRSANEKIDMVLSILQGKYDRR